MEVSLGKSGEFIENFEKGRVFDLLQSFLFPDKRIVLTACIFSKNAGVHNNYIM